MEFRRFNIIVLITVALATSLFAALNFAANIYGLYGDVRGRFYSVLGAERSGKYLLSFNYVPLNFDVLLIGSSITDNWDTSRLKIGRTYNSSLSGGNITEAALIADNVLQRRKLKAAIFVIFPYMTETHGRKSGYMTPQEYWSGLGSVQLLGAYASQWAIARGWLRQEFTPSGQFLFEIPPGEMPALDGSVGASDFTVDETARREYAALLERVRANGARVIGVIPPISQSLERLQGKAYRRYEARFRELFRPDELIIDLNMSEQLAGMRADPLSYPDGHHLSTIAANEVMRALDSYLD